MLKVDEIIGKAQIYLIEVMPDFAKLQPKVEEIERRQDSSVWQITFQVETLGNPKAESLADLLSQRTIVKVVSLDGSDGSLIAVKDPSY